MGKIKVEDSSFVPNTRKGPVVSKTQLKAPETSTLPALSLSGVSNPYCLDLKS